MTDVSAGWSRAAAWSLRADAVVIGAGVIARRAARPARGTQIGERGGVRCSSRLETSTPGCSPPGDICEYDSVLHGGPMRIEHWDVAFNHGKTAALNMLGRDVPHKEVPYFYSVLADWGELEYVGPAYSVGRGDHARLAARTAASPTGTCRTASSRPRSRSGAPTTSTMRAAARDGCSTIAARRWRIVDSDLSRHRWRDSRGQSAERRTLARQRRRWRPAPRGVK